MRINSIETKAYVISAEAEGAAKDYFKAKAAQFEGESKAKVTVSLEYGYTPILVLYAIKRDMQGRGTIIHGMENRFHIGLKDEYLYVIAQKAVGESAKGALIKPHDLKIERIKLLSDIASLSPKALQTLGYLLDHGTINFEQLDMPMQTAAKELAGRKYADIYRPVDRESEITTALKELLEFHDVTPVWKVRPLIPAPSFMHPRYNISAHLETTNVVEEDYKLERIAYAPERIAYLIGTMFNCSLGIERIIYMPYVEASFSWGGKQSSELRYLACPKTIMHKKYLSPKKLKTITIGTKGHGLEAIPLEDVAINFSNVAGMDDVKEKLKEGIIYPIAHPELSKEYGNKAGGGVLLYGPPGCGKTYIMRATVGEAGVNFYSISVQEIVGDDVESAAKRVDESFNEARIGAPSILFFDEIDALGGSRRLGQTGGERRIVNQFLTNMEGVGTSIDNVLVVGSTNAPWDMDAALRRSGRFTTKILIPPPDQTAREALFQVHLKGRPIAQDIDVKKLAEFTENYSSADITAICDEAAKIPWSQSVQGQERREITMADFQTVLGQHESSLTPWLRVAEKQLRESGEADIFPELSDYVFKRAGGIEMISQPTLKFADVGGLEIVKEEIRNKIVYPLLNPQTSEKYGRKVGGGVLFYGPPGCGKTYIAKATAGECGASFFNVKMTDLLSPEEGVTEKRLHSIFERASRNTPAVIFFDEIDAVAGRRSSAEGGTERRLINQFLVEMDGFEKKEGVVVLAATNAPWDMDPALRRAGRFSDQIFLPPPDAKSREEVFRIHCGKLPLAHDIDYPELARRSEGYGSADIKLVCDEAAKIPWKESMTTGQSRQVIMDDFIKVLGERKSSITPWLKQAEKQLKESGESEVYPELSEYVLKRVGGLDAVTKPSMNFADVGGLDEVKEEIKNKVVYPVKNPELAKEYGRTVSGGMLLYGPPGCGKTYIARAIAGECGASFYNVKITDLMSPVEGETEKRLHEVFDRAGRNTPAVVFFDEIDAIAGMRSQVAQGAERRLINQFLTELDGFEKKEGVVVLAATNAPWDIDPALRRAGRFSDQIFLPPPDAKSREEIFRICMKKLPAGEGIDYAELASLTNGYSSADIKLLCDEAAKIPWKETMETGKKRPISMDDLRTVQAKRPSSLGPWFKQAGEELKKSGRGEDYVLLAKTLAELAPTQPAMDEGEILRKKKAEVEYMMEQAKGKYRRGEIEEETLQYLAKEYQKTIIELEAKIAAHKEAKT